MKASDYKGLIMSKKEIAKAVDEQMEHMQPDVVLDMILHICETSEKEEPGKFKEASQMTKLLYTAHEMYKRGFAEAIYLCNESLKMVFRESA